MELVLSRKLADQRVFPAIDVTLSGTRKEEKLYSAEEIDQIWKLRRVLTSVSPVEGMELLSQRVGAFQDNAEFLHSLGGRSATCAPLKSFPLESSVQSSCIDSKLSDFETWAFSVKI